MQTIRNVPFDEIEIGQSADYRKIVRDEDVLMFAKLSGDVNPVHLDEEYAKTTQFGGRIAHGMYTAALMSAAMATTLPGPGSVYLSQTMKFRAPVRIGDELTVHLEVTNKRERNKSVTVMVRVTNQDGAKVVTGEATAIVPNERIVIDAPDLPLVTIGDYQF